ncbi:Immediate-early protein 2 [Streptomyces agglomeratus]|uniref:Immediate-early protein 2 n=1 Tax=Streptomyces agglomeratus TaxID=285458 RepID=A0A1E5PFR0_9ACTN|nr:Immediate-early protein 2 [Streptomyces agglomeratus]OEJ28367.1 Immediate-early protein 2 [Streptomyces agglomeratus]OEJ37567.1 Immediate-early protein 2 [Streptomyces agglomeratus]OEJ48048.1 Immediate-early protein 2 [Streptomyces agglomeratus]OEJ57434.1 Immediate-early protein 2 [Streptomyces agglomeratus]
MALFRIERRTPLSAGEAWRRLTDWQHHAVPLTRITVTPPPPTGTGTLVVARTGAGRLGFDDPMEVVAWEPPQDGGAGHCRLEKRGGVVLGWAEIDVRPAPGGAVAVWTEDLRLRGLPGAFDGLVARAGRLVFGRAVTGLLGPPAGR